jgi:hypothetical protein
MILNDTSKDADRVQIELLRSAGTQGRFRRMVSLSHYVITLSKRAIARQNPGLNAREQALMFVLLHYGASVEKGVRMHLANQEIQ